MKLVSFLSLLVLMLSCSVKNTTNDASDATSEKETAIICEISINYAKNFSLKSLNNGYRLQLIDPNTHKIERTFELTYDLKKSGESVIHLPIKNITALSQTTVGMMSSLDALDQLIGILNIDYVYDPEVIEKFENGGLTEFKDESNFSVENAIESKTDLIIYSGFSREFPQERKLRKFGIAAIPDYDWRENHPLGRAEWIKFIGVLCGKVKEANDLFDTIESNYLEMSKKFSQSTHKPSVISGNFRGDQWTAPAGESYMAILFADAGAKYVYSESKGTGSIFKSMERIIKDNESTDYWINPGFSSKTQVLAANPKGKYLGPYKNGVLVYCYSYNMNRFWERGAIEPHLILSDFIEIFHPTMQPDARFYFYKRLID